MKYFGTVTITLHGLFDADGEEEILDDALACASNCSIETEIVDLEEATRRFSKNITAEIIGRVDTTAYDKRVEQRKEKEKLKKELDKRKKEIQKKLDDEYYASKDETYAEMLRQYESL